jgi:hypothetical protein
MLRAKGRLTVVNNHEHYVQLIFGDPDVSYGNTDYLRNRLANVSIPWEAANPMNPCNKPVAMWQDWLRTLTRCQLLLDLFAGTGSATLAALRLKTGIDIISVEKDVKQSTYLQSVLQKETCRTDETFIKNPQSGEPGVIVELKKIKTMPRFITIDDEVKLGEVPGGVVDLTGEMDPESLVVAGSLKKTPKKPTKIEKTTTKRKISEVEKEKTATPKKKKQKKRGLPKKTKDEEEYEEHVSVDEDQDEEEWPEDDDEDEGLERKIEKRKQLAVLSDDDVSIDTTSEDEAPLDQSSKEQTDDESGSSASDNEDREVRMAAYFNFTCYTVYFHE